MEIKNYGMTWQWSTLLAYCIDTKMFNLDSWRKSWCSNRISISCGLLVTIINKISALSLACNFAAYWQPTCILTFLYKASVSHTNIFTKLLIPSIMTDQQFQVVCQEKTLFPSLLSKILIYFKRSWNKVMDLTSW